MKIRRDFVTNSSSSSFIINKRHLDSDQIEAIRRHGEIGDMLGIECADEEWHIEENDRYIGGRTLIDNFDMREFLEQIEVNMRYVDFNYEGVLKLPSGASWRDLL